MDLLEKAFVIRMVGGYSRNLRKEISKRHKVFFQDLGIRNALIEKFTPIHLRDDGGRLWENFLFVERSKLLNNRQIRANQFFWRLQTGAEIDYVEEYQDKPTGFEFKFNYKHAKAPQSWLATYPEAHFHPIHLDNWLSFILTPSFLPGLEE
ncbi:MAG: DUF4143 domain-containing protein [Haliscomenobacter sp.]|nr:DUF4143 domain-containing protein [Haliscomenobacter sp.]MBK8652821.1 DUF4143 domain-containing protein [Haliscomenobacter sp.]MBP9076795.1 DUF4143 domain-containing protein [Haliscomenobacter sp.]MBP9872584.1 DUF4143 domain-containing protein [Haliscomenobacter sp.]